LWPHSHKSHQIDLWDLTSQNLIRQIRVDNSQINAIAFSPDSQSLAWSGERTVQILYIDDETTSRQLVGYTGGVEGSGFYEGGQLVDREIINDIVFSPDGKLLAAGTGLALQGDCYSQWTVDHTVRIWRVDDRQRLHVFTEPQFGVEAVAFSPDGSLLAGVGGTHESYLGNTNSDWLWCSGEQDAIVRLWDVESGQLVREMASHKTLITGVAFSPDGAWLITSGTDGTMKRWANPNKTQSRR